MSITPAKRKQILKRRKTKKVRWLYKHGFASGQKHQLLYRDDVLGVQVEIITRVAKDTSPPVVDKQEIYRFIDGDDEEFQSEAALIKAIEKIPNAKSLSM